MMSLKCLQQAWAPQILMALNVLILMRPEEAHAMAGSTLRFMILPLWDNITHLM